MAGGGNTQTLGQGVKSSPYSTGGSVSNMLGQALQGVGAQPSQFGQPFGGAARFTQFNPGVQRNTFQPQQYAAPQMSPGTPQMQTQGIWNPRAPRGAGYDGMQFMPGGQPGELMHDNGYTGVPQGQMSYGNGQGGFVYGPTPWNVGGTQQPQTMPGRDIGIFGRRGPWNEVA